MITKKNISVLGGGCAGYSLVKQISKINKVKIDFYLGSNINKNNFWGFWKFNDFDFPTELLSGKWHKWKIITNRCESIFESIDHPYCLISRDKWINHCKDEFNKSKINFYNNDVFEEGGVLKDDNGKKISSDLIFDSRSLRINERTYVQHFKGFVIESDKECFDESTAILMDFRCDQSKGIQFIYLLPFSKKIALVEPTVYSFDIKADSFYFDSMKKYLKNNYGLDNFKLISEEKGAIPLSFINNENTNNSINIGIRGLANRQSSGYTFYFIQQQVNKIYLDLSKNKKPSNTEIHSSLINFLDKIFLDVLKTNPARASEIFDAFGKSFNGDEMAFFMSSKIKYKSLLRMIFNLPFKIFMNSFLRCFFK